MEAIPTSENASLRRKERLHEWTAEPKVWDTEEAAKLAREAYTYTGRMSPADAPPEAFEDLGAADAAVVEAQRRGDWPGYLEVLRQLMRVAKRERLVREREREGAA